MILGREQFLVLWKIYKCSFIPNCTRKIVWLLINNIHEKLEMVKQKKWRISRNQGKIMPSRSALDMKAKDLIGFD